MYLTLSPPFLAAVACARSPASVPHSPRSAKADAGLKGAERWGLIFMITLDVQMLLGLLLYGVLSPVHLPRR